MSKVELPKVFIDWINENSAPTYVNNSRKIYTAQLTFLYGKWLKGKNEYWAGQIEDMTGISYDYKNTDPVGND